MATVDGPVDTECRVKVKNRIALQMTWFCHYVIMSVKIIDIKARERKRDRDRNIERERETGTERDR